MDKDAHDHVDGCVCDIELRDDEATADADLPAATGGVAAAQLPSAEINEADGCDLDFNKFDPTTDEDLPVATGGVA